MNILLLTDFSSNAKYAHRYAIELYKDRPVNIILLHVKKQCLSPNKCSGSCTATLHQKLNTAANQLFKINSNNQLQTALVEGSFIEEIRSAVIKHNIDLLVIGAKGATMNTKKAVGNHTKDIASKVKCPAIIVFENSPIELPKAALFPVNYTDALYPACLDKLKSIPIWKDLKIKILELKSPTKSKHLMLSSKQILENNLKQHNVEFLDYTEGVIQLTKEAIKYDLMVFAAKNLSIGNQIFNELDKYMETFKFKTPLYVLHA